MNKRDKIYWHDAFFEALQQEFHQYMDYLKFQNEHTLSKEALKMDVLIIKKDKGVRIEKNIGRIFREHNIFEYKSEADSFSRWDYSKILGYAHLYSSFEQVPESEITISIALTMFPRELVKILENERGLKVQDLGDGLYYVEGETFPVQIMESNRLSPDANMFLRNLRSNLSIEDIQYILQSDRGQKLLGTKNVYLDRLVQANFDSFMEAITMSDAVEKLFLEGAKKYGWLDKRDAQRDEQRKIETAKKMLTRGYPVEEVAAITELQVETLMNLQ